MLRARGGPLHPTQQDEQEPAPAEPKEQDTLEPQKPVDDEIKEVWCEVAGTMLPIGTCDAAAEFGQAFEAAWGASLLERSGNRATTMAAEGIVDSRRAWARRQVLLETVEHRSSTVRVAETLKRTTQREDLARSIMDAELVARTRPLPVSPFGKRAAERFGRWA